MLVTETVRVCFVISVGSCVGKCYVAGEGMALVFDDPDSPNYFTIQLNSTGARLRRRRDQIDWRGLAAKTETKETQK